MSTLSPPSWFCGDCKESHGQLRYNTFKDLISSGIDLDILYSDFVKAGVILNECSTLDTQLDIVPNSNN